MPIGFAEMFTSGMYFLLALIYYHSRQLLLHRSKYKGRRGCIFFVYKGLQLLCCFLGLTSAVYHLEKSYFHFRHFFLVVGAPHLTPTTDLTLIHASSADETQHYKEELFVQIIL